jgi:mycothione reductase
MDHFDLIIVGSGSGNTILDDRFADWNVAMIEAGVFGGTCLNVGCIPSKMLIYPADTMREARHLDQLGVDFPEPTVRWRDLRDRVFSRIDAISDGGADYRANQDNVTLFRGTARFTGPHTFTVELSAGGTAELTGDRVVLAAGARPVIPPIDGLAETPYVTSDEIMRLDEVPERLFVLGGGFIALEQAHLWHELGSQVTMAVRRDHVLHPEDRDVRERMTALTAERLDLRTGTRVVRVDHDGDQFRVELTDGETTTAVVADQFLVATGRHPNGDVLCAPAGGVELDADGYVVTDPFLRTTAADVWALGDVRSHLQLKHVANRDARTVQHNLLHPDDPQSVDDSVVPWGIFTQPQIGAVGATEQQLEADGVAFRVGRRDYGGVAYGWAREDTEGFAKVLVGNDGTILGGHIIGSDAAVLIQPIVQAMAFGQRADEVARNQLWPHPALSEVVENALLDALD